MQEVTEISGLEAPPFIPLTTSPEELARILEAQRIETKWWGDRKAMQTIEDINREVDEGRAVRVPNAGQWYKISDHVPGEFRVLENRTADLLEQVANMWGQKLQELDLATEGGTFDQDAKNPFLVISSLARTVEYQRELQRRGLPAVDGEASTHTKLGAFDVGIVWFEEHRPDLLAVLVEVLDSLRAQNRINNIEEPQVGAMHVAHNPTLKTREN